jgi:hypothetical protein
MDTRRVALGILMALAGLAALVVAAVLLVK